MTSAEGHALPGVPSVSLVCRSLDSGSGVTGREGPDPPASPVHSQLPSHMAGLPAPRNSATGSPSAQEGSAQCVVKPCHSPGKEEAGPRARDPPFQQRGMGRGWAATCLQSRGFASQRENLSLLGVLLNLSFCRSVISSCICSSSSEEANYAARHLFFP